MVLLSEVLVSELMISELFPLITISLSVELVLSELMEDASSVSLTVELRLTFTSLRNTITNMIIRIVITAIIFCLLLIRFSPLEILSVRLENSCICKYNNIWQVNLKADNYVY